MRYHSLLDHVQQLEKLGVVAIRLPRQKQLWVLPLLRVLRDDFLGVVHSHSQRAVLDQHELTLISIKSGELLLSSTAAVDYLRHLRHPFKLEEV